MLDSVDEQIYSILCSSHTIAVVGLSPKLSRPSYQVASQMQQYGFKVFPVRPAVDEILGERVYRTLSDIGSNVDIVNLFRTTEHIPKLVDQAIEINARCLWLQDGIQHASTRKAQAAGIAVFMDRCILRDYRRLCLPRADLKPSVS